jgi:hypothetical protein
MMVKNYFYIILLLFVVSSANVFAQENKQPKTQENSSEQLTFYPNPVTDGKIFISGRQSISKEVSISDVLGKVVIHNTLTTKELNISSLKPGVYMIKIKEAENTVIRKLIVR